MKAKVITRLQNITDLHEILKLTLPGKSKDAQTYPFQLSYQLFSIRQVNVWTKLAKEI